MRPAELKHWLAEEAQAPPHDHDHHGHDHDNGHGHAHAHRHDVNRHDEAIRAFTLTAEEPIAQATFDLFWTLLRSTHGSKLLRFKGLVCLRETPERPLLVHAVQQIMHPPILLDAWPDADRRSRLVLIVKDIAPAVVERLWAAFLGQTGTQSVPA